MVDHLRSLSVPTAAWFGAFGLLLTVDSIEYSGSWGPMLAYCLSFCTLSAIVMLSAWSQAPHWEQRSGFFPVMGGIGIVVLLMSTTLSGHVFSLIVGYALLVACTVTGVLIGRRIVDPGYLWPLTIVMVAFDLWSVGSAAGVTQTLVLEPEATATRAILVLSFPILGLGVEPVLGIGDVIVVGLFFSSVYHLGLSLRSLSIGLASGFLCCLVSLVIFQVPLPALAFIAPLGVGALGRAARPAARDVATALIFCLVGLSLLHWLRG